jgi:hypothetical protein
MSELLTAPFLILADVTASLASLLLVTDPSAIWPAAYAVPVDSATARAR